MVWLEFTVVMVAIFFGARLGGIGLGVAGGLGLGILIFAFHLEPTAPPIDVLLMIMAVVTASASLQAAGGLAFLVEKAEKLLRSRPHWITFLGPLVAFAFTLVSGTGHVAYSILPIIAEVARETGIRPERPLAVAVIASQQAITASPISAASVAFLALTAPSHIELLHILLVSVPSTLMGVLVAAFVMNRVGVELDDDPVYQSRKQELAQRCKSENASAAKHSKQAKYAVALFLLAIALIVVFGSLPGLRPEWGRGSALRSLPMATVIEVLMLAIAAMILGVGKVSVDKLAESSVFKAGMQAVIAIFGIAWLGDTFFAANKDVLSGSIKDMVTAAPWSFAVALFLLSILLFSQAATVRALMPLGLSLGIPAPLMLAMFPAVNGFFFLPNYPTIVAAVQFDRTGTTRIGKYVLNHSFMLPGLLALVTSVGCGFLLVALLF